jgi:hypothetical protein
MANYSSRLTFLRDAFEHRAIRYPWVRARFITRRGRWHGTDIGRVPSIGSKETDLVDKENSVAENRQLYNDLYDLTDRAGIFTAKAIRSRRYKSDSALLRPVFEGLRDFFPDEVWLRLLLHAVPHSFHFSRRRQEKVSLPFFDENEVSGCIDNYSQVCVEAFDNLKAGLSSISIQIHSNPNPGGRPRVGEGKKDQHAEMAKKSLYDFIRSGKKPGVGAKTLFRTLKTNNDFKELVKQAGLTSNEKLIRAALRIETNKHPDHKTRSRNVS